MVRHASLSPASWPEGTVEDCLAMLGRPETTATRVAEGAGGAVAGTTSPAAVYAGIQALRLGGSAVDAALACALTQICLAAGSWVSYAGILSMVAYDASTRELHSLSAGYGTFGDETDPASIPGAPTPSGRTALVPGFMAGVQAAHDRFGKLGFATLFEPAIHFADAGFPLPPMLSMMMQARHDAVTRLPEGRRLLSKPDSRPYERGDLFRQPELAKTLDRVATQGAAYFYEGPWARRFVDAVRAEGGRATERDLASYRALWVDPLRTTYRNNVVAAMGLPDIGGVSIIEALNLLGCANLRATGHPSHSAEALDTFIQIARRSHLLTTASSRPANASPGALTRRLSAAHARDVWKQIDSGERASLDRPFGISPHSDAVVAVDEGGSVVALTHSINTFMWGHTGIFVDGVSIPDSANFQQPLIEQVGPGARLPNPMSPLIVTRDGTPILATSAIGAGLHEVTMHNLVNVLEFDMDLAASAAEPAIHPPAFGLVPGLPMDLDAQMVTGGDFDDAVIAGVRARGQPVVELSPVDAMSAKGYWVGLDVAPAADGVLAVKGPHLDGDARVL